MEIPERWIAVRRHGRGEGRSQKAQRDIIPGQTAGEIGASGNERSVMAAWEPKNPCGSAHPAPILHRSPRAMPTAYAQSRRSPWQMGHFSGTIHIGGGGWLPVQEFRKGRRSASGPAMRRALGKDPVRDPGAGNGPRQKGPGAAQQIRKPLSEQGSGAYGTEHRRV